MRSAWLIVLVPLFLACGDRGSSSGGGGAGLDVKPGEERVWIAGSASSDALPEMAALAARAEAAPAGERQAITVDYPLDGSVFPPDIAAPTMLWHDDAKRADTWLVGIAFSDGGEPTWVLVDGPPPPEGVIDREALGETNEVYEPTPYQASARAWRPSAGLWAEIKRRTVDQPATLTFFGLRAADATTLLSEGAVTIQTSKDPVGAPIFYRDVPLMPGLAERDGQIQPLKSDAIPLIAWRLKDVGRDDSRPVLRGMPSCANCHSFSGDGQTLAMDVDGPQGDKGAYALAPVEKHMMIAPDNVITWNSFPDKPSGHKTIGFLSRISPDAKWVLSTVNEALYVQNFPNYKFLQVFYPTRGILASYSTETGKMQALPGADDTEYVHCNPVWSPDGRTIVFSRAKAMDPYVQGKEMAKEPNDPNEPRMLYDLYRLDFNDGKGGEAVPVEGASDNGMSNTFPKISPDGKWIVYTKCRNGLLMRPDGKLWIVPLEGGEARELSCNLPLMNSWHSFSPNGRWLVWSSKSNRPYTQMFLTHLDDEGNSTPAILVENATADNRAVNIPEFVNAPYDAIETIEVPAVNHHLHYARALALLEQDKYREAIPHLELAVKADVDFSRAHSALGYCLARSGVLDRAEDHFLRTLAIDPESPGANTGLGAIRMQQKRFAEARHYYERALALTPRSHAYLPLRNMGLLLREEGRDAEALDFLLQALAIDDSEPLAHRTAGLILIAQGSRDGVGALRKALSLSPDDVELRAELAWVQATHPKDSFRNGPAALDLATEAVRRSRGQAPKPLAALAAAQAELGRFDEAVVTARRALAVADGSDPALAARIREQLRAYQGRRPWRDD